MGGIATLAKEHRERLIFEAFATAADMVAAGDHIESRPPPEPDILLRSQRFGLQAFELVEIVDQGLQSSVARQLDTKTICRDYLDALPPLEKEQFSKKYQNADIAFEFRSNFSLQRRKNFLPRLFAALASLPDDADGDLSTVDLGLNKELSFLHVSRGNLVGPMFDAGSAVWVGDPTVDAIRGKLGKAYAPQGALNLLAFVESQPLFPDDVWLPALEDFLSSLDSTCQFARIYVFTYQNRTVVREWHRPAA